MNFRYSVLFFIATSLLFSLGTSIPLGACTGVLLKAANQSSISGRTVEFGQDLQLKPTFIPRNINFTATSPLGNGLKYKSKYAAIGISCFNDQILMDGMNEAGLVAGAFYFPNYAQYTPATSANQNISLSPVDFVNWVLTQFSNLDDLQKAIGSIVIVPTVYSSWGTTAPPMHYIVYDKSGRSIVIEPTSETLIVYENPIGAITNSPSFDWHLTNLSNYINLNPYNLDPLSFSGFQIEGFGQGSGMLGLPGDFTPPSRFIRAAFFSNYAYSTKNANELVGEIFHLLNQFDIPMGAVRSKSNGKISYDITYITTVKNPNSLTFYYKTHDQQVINSLDLSQMNLNGSSIKTMPLDSNLMTINVSDQLF